MKKNTLVLVLCIIGAFIIGGLLVELTREPSLQSEPKWISSDENVISWKDAGNYIKQEKTVEGTVVRTHRSPDAIFLNFHDPYKGYFFVVIFPEDLDNFPFKPEDYYEGKEIRVTGEIKMHNDSPQIIVKDPSQIEVVYGSENFMADGAPEDSFMKDNTVGRRFIIGEIIEDMIIYPLFFLYLLSDYLSSSEFVDEKRRRKKTRDLVLMLCLIALLILRIILLFYLLVI